MMMKGDFLLLLLFFHKKENEEERKKQRKNGKENTEKNNGAIKNDERCFSQSRCNSSKISSYSMNNLSYSSDNVSFISSDFLLTLAANSEKSGIVLQISSNGHNFPQ